MGPLPIHGFVLAGGQSRRMGQDKARIELGGRPLIARAVDRLAAFCESVSICGDRPDLACFGPIIPDCADVYGPAAGICAGLAASEQRWSMFTPVDVPLVPGTLLVRWARTVLERNLGATVLRAGGREHPVFCLTRSELAAPYLKAAIDAEGRLTAAWRLLETTHPGAAYALDAENLVEVSDRSAVTAWFMNVNTPQELAAAEQLVGREEFSDARK